MTGISEIVPKLLGFNLFLFGEKKIFQNRSLGALRAPTSSSRPFGPLDMSFAPFGRSGQGTHASYIDYIRCFVYS